MSKFHVDLIGTKSAEFIEAIDAIVRPSDANVKLYAVSPIKAFSNYKDAYDLIGYLINLNNRQHAFTATILNSIFTQKTDCFIFSRRIMSDLLKEEMNHGFTKFHTTYFGPMMTNYLQAENPLLVEIEPQSGMKAGFYRLNQKHPAHKILKNIVSETFLEASFERKYEWYKKEKSKGSIPKEEADMIKERARRIKKGVS
jgi:hypothetical protein